METILLLFLFAVSMVGSPGPANMLLMAAGARFGYRRSFPLLIGTMTGFFFVGIAVASGLGALFSLFPVLRYTFLALSAVYLLYLAYRIAFAAPNLHRADVKTGFLAGVPVHPLNPKAWAMLIAAYSQFKNPGWSPLEQFITLQSVFFAVGIVTNSMWCWGGDLLTRLVQNPRTLVLINRTLAATMLVIVGISVWQSGLLSLT
ncbi:LysE family transporter [Sneathiella sp. P13V-1]|uniref:LysE family translocator n=1 Tax=Sneathiella sp. P13V-1 TaxID=2697366 RepID=UPI00187BB962|nr:LysE family translocator [Sneathiella sp. P13V-1]MBE7638015.1 LysE family transporter [Sneathiella sp. P13V-1]